MTHTTWLPPAPGGKEKRDSTWRNSSPSSKAFTLSKMPLNCCTAVGITVGALVSGGSCSAGLTCCACEGRSCLFFGGLWPVMKWMLRCAWPWLSWRGGDSNEEVELIADDGQCSTKPRQVLLWASYSTLWVAKVSPAPPSCSWLRCCGHPLGMGNQAGRRSDCPGLMLVSSKAGNMFWVSWFHLRATQQLKSVLVKTAGLLFLWLEWWTPCSNGHHSQMSSSHADWLDP